MFVPHSYSAMFALNCRDFIMQNAINVVQRDGFQILLEGATSADKSAVLQALTLSSKLCNGESPKHVDYLISDFMEDNLLPHMEDIVGTERVRVIDSWTEKATVKEVCEEYLKFTGEKLTDDQLTNFVELVSNNTD